LLDYRPAFGRRVRERLRRTIDVGSTSMPSISPIISKAASLSALRVRAVQHGDGAQALVDLARFGHQRRLIERPHVEAARLHRHQERIGDGERGASDPVSRPPTSMMMSSYLVASWRTWLRSAAPVRATAVCSPRSARAG
jgi:hypothetical protein